MLSLGLLGAPACTLVVNHELDSKPSASARKTPDGGDATPDGSASDDGGSDGGDGASHPDGAQMESDGSQADAGTDADSGTPPPNANVKICAGQKHACGLSNEGKVTCWGDDSQGQGDLPTAKTYRDIACGDSHTCAIDDTGHLVCVGRNADGQLSPVPPVPKGPFVQVTAGDAHTCVLDADGVASCFGSDALGQATPPSQRFKSISAGTGLTCGIASADSSLVCWGTRGSSISASAFGKKLASIDAGTSFVCGVTQTGGAYCWGDDTYLLPTISKAAEVSASGYGVCVLLKDGTASCWYKSSSFKLFPAARAPFLTLAVGGDGGCAVPVGGPIVCEPSQDSYFAPGPPDFP
jgi:hypothetical protein